MHFLGQSFGKGISELSILEVQVACVSEEPVRVRSSVLVLELEARNVRVLVLRCPCLEYILVEVRTYRS